MIPDADDDITADRAIGDQRQQNPIIGVNARTCRQPLPTLSTVLFHKKQPKLVATIQL